MQGDVYGHTLHFSGILLHETQATLEIVSKAMS